jgi:hypothetical protein
MQELCGSKYGGFCRVPACRIYASSSSAKHVSVKHNNNNNFMGLCYAYHRGDK